MPLFRFSVALVALTASLSSVVAVATEPVPAALAPQEAVSLDGQAWELVAYRSDTGLVEVEIEPKSEPLRFRFDAGNLSGRAGCNQLVGSYIRDGDTLEIGTQMASTMMACPEPLMAQEQAVIAALTTVSMLRQTGERLELLDENGDIQLALKVRPISPLHDHVWTLDALRSGAQSFVTPLGKTPITLDFQEGGTLNGNDGCNRYVSGYTLDQGRLQIGPLATMRMACQGPDGVAEQAAAYAQAMSHVNGYHIVGTQLTLIDTDGETVARFQGRLADGL